MVYRNRSSEFNVKRSLVLANRDKDACIAYAYTYVSGTNTTTATSERRERNRGNAIFDNNHIQIKTTHFAHILICIFEAKKSPLRKIREIDSVPLSMPIRCGRFN